MTQLLVGGRVHSPTHPDATAMAVADGAVVWLGKDDDGSRRFPDAEIVGLGGAFVAPAFVDSHVHVTATGLTSTRSPAPSTDAGRPLSSGAGTGWNTSR